MPLIPCTLLMIVFDRQDHSDQPLHLLTTGNYGVVKQSFKNDSLEDFELKKLWKMETASNSEKVNTTGACKKMSVNLRIDLVMTATTAVAVK